MKRKTLKEGFCRRKFSGARTNPLPENDVVREGGRREKGRIAYGHQRI